MLAKEIPVDLLSAMTVEKLSLLVSSAGVMDVHWLLILEYMLVQLMSWTGSNLK